MNLLLGVTLFLVFPLYVGGRGLAETASRLSKAPILVPLTTSTPKPTSPSPVAAGLKPAVLSLDEEDAGKEELRLSLLLKWPVRENHLMFEKLSRIMEVIISFDISFHPNSLIYESESSCVDFQSTEDPK